MSHNKAANRSDIFPLYRGVRNVGKRQMVWLYIWSPWRVIGLRNFSHSAPRKRFPALDLRSFRFCCFRGSNLAPPLDVPWFTVAQMGRAILCPPSPSPWAALQIRSNGSPLFELQIRQPFALTRPHTLYRLNEQDKEHLQLRRNHKKQRATRQLG